MRPLAEPMATRPPAPFVIDPALGVIATQQAEHSARRVSLGVIGFECDGAVIARQRRIELTLLLQDDAAVGMGLGAIGCVGEGAIVAGECRGQLPLLV